MMNEAATTPRIPVASHNETMGHGRLLDKEGI